MHRRVKPILGYRMTAIRLEEFNPISTIVIPVKQRFRPDRTDPMIRRLVFDLLKEKTLRRRLEKRVLKLEQELRRR